MPSGLPGDTRAMLGLPLRHLVNYLLSQGSDCNSGKGSDYTYRNASTAHGLTIIREPPDFHRWPYR